MCCCSSRRVPGSICTDSESALFLREARCDGVSRCKGVLSQICTRRMLRLAAKRMRSSGVMCAAAFSLLKAHGKEYVLNPGCKLIVDVYKGGVITEMFFYFIYPQFEQFYLFF